MTGKAYGYARVSTGDQDTTTQVDRLRAAGCDVIRQEKVSGKSRDGRDELDTLLEFLREGDTLVVVKLDRLGRSTRDVLNLVHDIEAKGAHLRILEPDISTAGPLGKMVVTVLGMVAEMELGFIRDRQRAGIDHAKARGVYKGRPVTIDRQRIQELQAQGWGVTAIARELDCTRAAIYKIMKNQ